VKIALTGGTGFVGSHLIDLALERGHEVRALTRRPQEPRAGVTWVPGDLARVGELAQGADAAVHVAGLVSAPNLAAFRTGNVAGTEAVIAAAQAAGVRRFVHVSSLAAREPALSDYGRSKAESEDRVMASGLDWTVVRPPAIFGPRDTEMRELFRMAARGLIPLPPRGARLSVLYVRDLAHLLLALAEDASLLPHQTIEPDDGTANGWDYRDFAHALGIAVGRKVSPLPLPAGALTVAGAAERLVRGKEAKLTRDRVRYFVHADWTVHHPPPPELWRAATPTQQALAQTAAWYRAHGLL
jgi:nucleoside-diphosphate-sugar epimerase